MPENSLTEASVREALADFPDPETGRGVERLGQVVEVKITGADLNVKLGLTSWAAPLHEETAQRCQSRLNARLPEAGSVTVDIVPFERKPDKVGQIGLTVKSVIAVGSSKGGVGKSTVAASIAYGLSKAGAAVGLMDADVYGPSVPQLLGVEERPTGVDNRMQPIIKDDLRVMSMGFMVPKEEAVIWRGPMLHGAITQFLRDTDWGELDYLIIDMPPGTGDNCFDPFTTAAAHGRRGCLHATGGRAVGCREGDRYVPQSEHPRAGHGGEHELLPVS